MINRDIGTRTWVRVVLSCNMYLWLWVRALRSEVTLVKIRQHSAGKFGIIHTSGNTAVTTRTCGAGQESLEAKCSKLLSGSCTHKGIRKIKWTQKRTDWYFKDTVREQRDPKNSKTLSLKMNQLSS